MAAYIQITSYPEKSVPLRQVTYDGLSAPKQRSLRWSYHRDIQTICLLKDMSQTKPCQLLKSMYLRQIIRSRSIGCRQCSGLNDKVKLVRRQISWDAITKIVAFDQKKYTQANFLYVVVRLY